MASIAPKLSILQNLPSIFPSLTGIKIPSILEIIGTSILLAVPKKKTTHSKKRMRSSGKYLKNLQNIVKCPFCGNPTLMHHLCHNCFTGLQNEEKSFLKDQKNPSFDKSDSNV